MQENLGKLFWNILHCSMCLLDVIIKLWCIQCVNVLDLCFAFVESPL